MMANPKMDRLNKIAARAACLSALIELALLLYPINIGILRALEIAFALAFLASASIALWRFKILRYLPAAILLCLIAAILAPGRPIDSKRLTQRYAEELKSYEGVRYFWGGENALGIDCSGLVRKGLIAANMKEGILRTNPAALREALFLWSHDCGARELGEGYGGRTRQAFKAGSVNAIESSQLKPGMLAVTRGGAHVMAYLGEGLWIEADPSLKRVTAIRPPTDNAWFNIPVQIVQWSQLSE